MDREPAEPRLEPLALRPVFLIAASGATILLLLAGRYGYHRDELYFLACGRHLAWGFVDQPPLTPLIARFASVIAPGSLVVLHVYPMAIYVGLVVITALMARELGAGHVGQVGVAFCTAIAPGPLEAGHLLSTEDGDLLLWALVAWLLIRMVRTDDRQLWLPIGLAIGIGLENKWSIGFLVVGLLVGLLVTPERRLLATPWFVAGIALALALWAPNLIWQADHAWPQLDMIASIQGGSSGLGPALKWIPIQFLLTGPVVGAVWVAGLLRLLRDPVSRPYRAIANAYVLLAIVMMIVAGDKPYYAAGLYAPLFAAGALPLERWLQRHRRGIGRPLAIAGIGLTSAVLLPVVLPILPASALSHVSIQDVNYDLGEQIGWPAIVGEVAGAWRALPANVRAHAAILTSNYGEAGAIERYGGTVGLPTPYSGHNSFWWWGKPPAGTRTVLVVGAYRRVELEQLFRSVVRDGTLSNPWGVTNEEDGLPMWVASGPRASWRALWPELRHYD